ncbi:MAG TPA: RICIN domain-containing protein [Desulfuromonadaceae bacterium]|nr:RICIN domain-containing protein [Desulfuromonadaceae bacterium]
MKQEIAKKILCRGLWLAAVVGICSSVRASVLWEGNATNGTSVFEGLETVNGTITVATDSTLGKVFKIEINTDNADRSKERCEVRGCNGFRMAQGGSYYLGWKSKLSLPTDPNQWQHVFQIHGYGPPGCLAPITMDTPGDGTITMTYQDPSGAFHVIWSAPLVTGIYNNFVLHLSPTLDEATGWIEFWYNGAAQKFTDGSTRYGVALWNGDYILTKWGDYRQGGLDGVGDNYVWRPRFATTYNEADPMIAASVSTSAIYQLQNVASGLVLNQQGSLTNGSKITQWTTPNSSQNLQWTLIPTSNGYYQINSVKSGKDAVVQSASTASGAGIIQWSFGSAGNDQWKPLLNSDGSVTFFNLKSGLVMEDPGASTSTSTQMDQWTPNGASNQKWNLLPQ